MCWDCGCKLYEDDMGSAHTLTTQRLDGLAKAAGKTPAEFLSELHQAVHGGSINELIPAERLEAMAKDMGHDVDDALRELHDSLHVHGYKHQGE